DLGQAKDRYFTLMAGFGFDAYVVSHVLRPLKDLIGSSAYVLEALRALAEYQATEFTLEMPDGTYSAKAFLVVVANSPSYAYKFQIAPYASHDDGLLDVLIFERPFNNRFGFIRQIADVIAKKHVHHQAVSYFQTKSINITSSPEVMMQLDGDAYGSTPQTVTVVPRALKVITPIHIDNE
ncbi:MAG: diacylglycerol/lipid kinase family protein, partial [Armatimonadota bacterium]